MARPSSPIFVPTRDFASAARHAASLRPVQLTRADTASGFGAVAALAGAKEGLVVGSLGAY